eukprot:gene10464-biopygen2912
MCRVGSAVRRRAALCAVWAAPCGAVRLYVPCGQRRVAPCGAVRTPCRVGTAVRRRAAPWCAVRRRVCRVATRRAVWQGRAVWHAVWHVVRTFFPLGSGAPSAGVLTTTAGSPGIKGDPPSLSSVQFQLHGRHGAGVARAFA